MLLNLSQVAESLHVNAAHPTLPPAYLGMSGALSLPMPAALFLVIRLFDIDNKNVIPSAQSRLM